MQSNADCSMDIWFIILLDKLTDWKCLLLNLAASKPLGKKLNFLSGISHLAVTAQLSHSGVWESEPVWLPTIVLPSMTGELGTGGIRIAAIR